MNKVDRSVVAEFVDRLAKIPADARPEWGSITPAQMVGHLTGTLRYAAGEGPDRDFVGSDNTRNIVGPEIIEGRMLLPRNVQLKGPDGKPMAMSDGDLDSFKGALTNYIDHLEQGDLSNRTHPIFGLLSPEQWCKLLAVHAEHHLKQFGA